MSFPVHDWQFWVVTALALLAAGYIAHRVLPPKWLPWKKKPKGRSATLTVGGKPVEKK
jgi:hypothetical protein